MTKTPAVGAAATAAPAAWAATPGGSNLARGGRLGVAFAERAAGRLTLGGGGGAGTTNNGTGTPSAGLASSGGAGGGMILIRARQMSGTGSSSSQRRQHPERG